MKCGQGRPRRLPGPPVLVFCLSESPMTTVAGGSTCGMPVPSREQEQPRDDVGGVRFVADLGDSDRKGEQEGEKGWAVPQGLGPVLLSALLLA